MTARKTIEEELIDALEVLRTANSQSNTKGRPVTEWFESHFDSPAAVSFITQGKQVGNRLKEQKGKKAPYTLFFFEDESLVDKTIEKAEGYYYEELRAIFYVLYDGADYSLKAIYYRDLSDQAVQEVDRILGNADTSKQTFSVSERSAGQLRSEASGAEAKPAQVGRNLLLYGAPGVGKSYAVATQVGEVNVERTVFHPDTQNSDFFGCLKPRSIKDGAGNAKVIYEFAPGPFSKALRSALSDPDTQHFLVIEELNRAPAASVFGELFQLLDRDEDGSSTYKISFPNPESEEWLKEQIDSPVNGLSIPANLSIIATMNSSDQGVYPLDTAFRRRWEQEYLPLYGGKSPDGILTIVGRDGATRDINWIDFLKGLNDFLIETLKVPEDRLIGQWFLKPREMGGGVPSKILLYLWDDLLRHHGRPVLFQVDAIRTFGEMSSAMQDGRQIFSDQLLEKLERVARSPSTPLQSDRDIVENEERD